MSEKTTCPDCSGFKHHAAAQCRNCRRKKFAERTRICPLCGGRKDPESVRCMKCRRARRATPPTPPPGLNLSRSLAISREVLALNLWELRSGKHLTHWELSKLAQVPQAVISNVENAKTGSGTIDHLISLAAALEVPVWYLLAPPDWART